MPTRPLKPLTLLVCAALSALAVGTAAAADPPARVGRIAVTQGQVGIAPEFGADPASAQVNWPVTTGNLITTAQGARTELRVGSTSIRLDGDSSLEILALDDDTVHVRLHYGSASLRASNGGGLAGFTLETPQVRVRLEQPGRVRIDAERTRDTTAINVFEGVALVEGNGSQLTVRAGRRAEITDEDVRTAAASRDAFDDWSGQRDRYQDSAATAVRYIGTEMTGYEDLDRYGAWRSDDDNGPLWYPTVASSWVPYRDGSWTWVEPWGWTWVDNAPWGYAPFHYGRWVNVHNRWAWAPGRRPALHPVWAPALVGWVGGGSWNVAFHDRKQRPALGWYPLSPRDRYEPGYRAPESHLRWWNNGVRSEGRHPRDFRPQGLTVVPQDHFNHGGRISVPRAPIATVPPVLAQNIPTAAPPPPAAGPGGFRNRAWRDGQPVRTVGNMGPGATPPARWERGDDRIDIRRPDGSRIDTDRVARDGFAQRGMQPGLQVNRPAPGLVQPAAPAQGLPVTSPTPHLPTQPLSTVTSPTPQPGMQPGVQPNVPLATQPGWPGRDRAWRDRDERPARDARDGRDNRDPRDQPGEWRRDRPSPQFAQPAQPMQQQSVPQQQAVQQPQPQPLQQMQPAPRPVQQPAPLAPPVAAPIVPRHGGWERREPPGGFQREAAQPRPAMPQQQMAQQQMAQQQAPQPAPVREMPREMPRPAMPQPAPPPVVAPQPQQQAAPAGRPAEVHAREARGGMRQHDR